MTVGTSIFLIAVGAILSYAITWELSAVNLVAVGVILMAAGSVSLAITVASAFRPNGLTAENDGGTVTTFGKVPPTPRWHTGDASTYGDTSTYTVPFDARETGGRRPPDVAPPVAVPWYGSDAEPYPQPYGADAQPYSSASEIADTVDDPAYGLDTPHRQSEPAPEWRDPET